jgi:hypothetical protein
VDKGLIWFELPTRNIIIKRNPTNETEKIKNQVTQNIILNFLGCFAESDRIYSINNPQSLINNNYYKAVVETGGHKTTKGTLTVL